MRPLLALVMSLSILGGVRAYLDFAATLRAERVAAAAAAPAAPAAAEGVFTIEVTLTFTAAADDFAIDPTTLLVRQQEHVLLRREGTIAAGEPIVVADVSTLVEGRNEFYVECIPQDDGAPQARAVRVRVLRDGAPVADNTLWSPPGQAPRGIIPLEIPRSARIGEDHDHAP